MLGSLRARRQREPLRDPAGPPGDDAQARRHHPHRIRAAGGSRQGSRVEGARANTRASRATDSTTRAGTWRWTCGRCLPSRRPSRSRRSNARRAAGRIRETTIRRRTRSGASTISPCGRTRDGGVAVAKEPLPQMPAELAELLKDRRRHEGTSDGRDDDRTAGTLRRRRRAQRLHNAGVPGQRRRRRVRRLPVDVAEGQVVLDVIHTIQATQADDLAVRWNCKAGKCGSCSAEVNGKPRLMCMTRMNLLRPGRADHRRADQDVPADQGPRDRRLVQLRSRRSRSRRSSPARPRPTADTG